MNRNISQTNEIQIYLKDIMWKLLAQWKAVLLTAVIMALFVCGAKYAKDTRTYKAEMAAPKPEGSVEERIASILDALSDEDRAALELIFREKKWLDRQRKYLDESIAMNIDPSNLGLLKITYDVDGNDASDLSVLLQQYSSFINGDRYRKSIGAVIDPEAETKYIGELIYTYTTSAPEVDSGQSGTMLAIQIIMPEGKNAEEVRKVSDKVLYAFANELQKEYKHTIKSVDMDVTSSYNYDNTNKQKDVIDRVNSMTTTFNNAISAMTDTQKSAYAAIESIINEGNSVEDSVPTEPAFSKKFAVLGFVLGLILYSFIYLVLIILRGGVGSAKNARNCIGTRLFGEIYYDSEPVGFDRLFHSNFIDKIHYRNNINQDTQVSRVSDSIEAVCNHIGDRNLTIVDLTKTSKTDNTTDRLKSIIKLIGNDIENKGIGVNLFEVSADEVVDERNMLNAGNTILVLSENTKIDTIKRVIQLCEDYVITVLGGVYISEM